MGTCCFGNRPPEKLVGVWTDNKYVQLTINESGNIVYQKQGEYTNTKFAGPTRFKDDKLFFCCCCCCLRGQYNVDDDSEPKLIANGTVLTKQSQ